MHQLLIALSLLLLASAGTSSVDKYKDLADANNKFGINLFKKLTETQKDNIIFSPLSISFALALTSLGAKRNTLNEMKKALFVSDIPDNEIHGKYKAFMNDMLSDNEKIQVSLANRLFLGISFQILPEFLQKSNDNYGAKPEKVDFSMKEKAASIVNKWVSENTQQKIENIVSKNDIGDYTVLLLVNALYFKSMWQEIFYEEYTEKKDFHVGPNNVVQTDFMHLIAEGLHGSNKKLHFDVFEKYFYANKFTFGIILPDLKKTSLKKIEEKFSIDQLNSIKLKAVNANLDLPKFTIETKFELKDFLQKLGINDMFDNKADLSGINGAKNLTVSKVLHKAIIEVEEKGVVAAAVTVVEVSEKSASDSESKLINFKADHPFLFYIKHKDSGAILFLGRFSKP